MQHNESDFYLVCVSAPNRFYLILCDDINYHDVISAANSYKSTKNVYFTDI